MSLLTINGVKQSLPYTPSQRALSPIPSNNQTGAVDIYSGNSIQPLHSERLGQFEERTRQAYILLEKTELRPSPLDVRELTIRAIDEAAKILNYPIYDIKKYSALQKSALPLIQDKMRRLFEYHEAKTGHRTHYVFIGRDAAMFYDAMAAAAAETPLEARIHLVTLSEELALDKSFNDEKKEYLAQNGISGDAIRNGATFVLIDTGFWGTVPMAIKDLVAENHEDGEAFSLYLIYKNPFGKVGCSPSPLAMLPWHTEPSEEKTKEFIELFKQCLPSLWTKIQWHLESARYNRIPSFTLNALLAHYMQAMPKFRHSATTIARFGNVIASLPHKRLRSYRECLADNSRISPGSKIDRINMCAVDPVAALKLQLSTVTYFASKEGMNMVKEFSKA